MASNDRPSASRKGRVMIGAAALTVIAVLAVAGFGPALGRRLPPATATRCLVVMACISTGVGIFVMSMLAFTWVAQLPEIAERGEWSAPSLRANNPVPLWLAVLAIVVVVGAVTQFSAVGAELARGLMRLRRACGAMRHVNGLVVLDVDRPDAFATTAAGGRIVVTRGMLESLTADERRALFAHERAHLRHHHGWWVMAANLAAAANPLLRATAGMVAHAVERWADEDAAQVLSDRPLVARTLARAALHVHHVAVAPAGGAAALGANVPGRVQALLAPPPPRRLGPVFALAMLVLTAAAAAAVVQIRADTLFDAAEARPEAPISVGQQVSR